MFRFLKKSTSDKAPFDYKRYWQDRYSRGETSGTGSYGILADYKAEVINDFLEKNDITSVIEFGCGDGNQLRLMNYQTYLGLDIARSAIDLCRSIFSNDESKSFIIYEPKYFLNNGYIKADLVVCLDVLYHIIDEWEFNKTLQDIFSCASRFVILYTNVDALDSDSNHIKFRNLMPYLSRFPDFKVEEILEQKYSDLSSAKFVFLKNKSLITERFVDD